MADRYIFKIEGTNLYLLRDGSLDKINNPLVLTMQDEEAIERLLHRYKGVTRSQKLVKVIKR